MRLTSSLIGSLPQERLLMLLFGGPVAFVSLLFNWPRKRLVEVFLHGGELLQNFRTAHWHTGRRFLLLQGIPVVRQRLFGLLPVTEAEPAAQLLLHPPQIIGLPYLPIDLLIDGRHRFVSTRCLQDR